jgi:hypothetical protein
MTTTNTSGGSARIYQFPARGRFSTSAVQNESSAAALAALRAPTISYGGWYHDEAIEAERTRKS